MTIDFSFDEGQIALQDAVRAYLRDRSPLTVVRNQEGSGTGYSESIWKEMAALGWLGVTIPTAFGGGGGDLLSLYPIYEEFGRSLFPSPHLDTCVIAARVLESAGGPQQKGLHLPAIASGDRVIALAVVEKDGVFGPTSVRLEARADGSIHRLRGRKTMVTFANSADFILCAARTGGSGSQGITLFLVDRAAPGVTCHELPNITGLPLFEVRFDDVAVSADDRVGGLGEGWTVLADAVRIGAVLQTATIAGAARAVLEMTTDYAKVRHQFGGPIGRHQAVQYMVTDILFDMHRIDLLARNAMMRIVEGRAAEREAAIAVAFGKRAAAHLHRQAHEVHAGVAFMLEHDLTLYSRRSKFWENNLGDARCYEDQIAAAMGF